MKFNFAPVTTISVKLPLFKREFAKTGWFISILAGTGCLLWRAWAIPGFEYSTGVFLIVLTLLLTAFAGPSTKSDQQFTILVFVCGTCILLLAHRFDAFMDGIAFAPSLLPVNEQVGLLSGLLWLIPVFTSLKLSAKLTDNIYLRSLYGALLVLTPSVFVLMSADWQMLFFRKAMTFSPKAIVIWFLSGYFFHFAANTMQLQRENPIATRLYFTYLGFFVLATLVRSFLFGGWCGNTP